MVNTRNFNKRGKPSKVGRNLVRWDSEMDLFLLLGVQSACNTLAIKLPWNKVAEIMNENLPGQFTEGAIVQHLAKLRSRPSGSKTDAGTPAQGFRSRKPQREESSSEDMGVDEQGDSDIEYKEPARRKSGARRPKAKVASKARSAGSNTRKRARATTRAKPAKIQKRTQSTSAVSSENEASQNEDEELESSDDEQVDQMCVGASWLQFSGNEKDRKPSGSHTEVKSTPKKSGILRLKVNPESLRVIESARNPSNSPSTGSHMTQQPTQKTNRPFSHSFNTFSRISPYPAHQPGPSQTTGQFQGMDQYTGLYDMDQDLSQPFPPLPSMDMHFNPALPASSFTDDMNMELSSIPESKASGCGNLHASDVDAEFELDFINPGWLSQEGPPPSMSSWTLDSNYLENIDLGMDIDNVAAQPSQDTMDSGDGGQHDLV
ncbi:hypothetical protein NUU61_008648 [Penicillium alfredii]|uniref:Myb-like domain-containing protein n=1 Tax=Penicillium alfredii TaxID=1506179 RepID=A0A9W9ELV0_9EURO|nr:uncharacterized protein NUU61_008648 [Penicillium alfredii]KAJ5084069.1 hypothetical protein NUU61_008648 [Penicillium alfredii]